MPKFRVEVSHAVQRAEAATRLRSFSDQVRNGLSIPVEDVREQWDELGNLDFAFRAYGFSVSGRLENREGIILVSGSLPFAALPFRGMIESEIAKKIREAIG